MMKPVFLALAALLTTAACSSFQKSETPPMRVLAGNIEGVVVQYEGPQSMLREADILARTHCERYGRPAILLNELPGAQGGAIAYYYCQG
jgi:hypothetical protein